MKSLILVLTAEGDEHADKVTGLLRGAGKDVVWFDLGQLPRTAALTYQSGSGGRRALSAGGVRVDLDEVASIWYRRPGLIGGKQGMAPFAKAETVEFASGLLGSVDCRWLPAHPAVLRRAECKIEQLSAAERLGLHVPPTLITSDPKEFLSFYSEHGGQVVSKVAHSGAFGGEFPLLARYTEMVSRRDLVFLNRIRNAPVTFQAHVPKRVEVRVTVVGCQVFAAEIHSQHSRHTRLDWRRYDLEHTPHLPHQLPAAIHDRCLQLTRELGLTYGALDFIVRPDGEYIFLELNPNGQYLWVEDLTSLPISAAVSDFLAGVDGPELPLSSRAARG
jgi:hypothetical protein